MIILTKGNIEDVYCTPLENSNDDFILYYFIKFTNRITQDIVTNYYEDLSSLKRYQKFEIDTAILNEYNTGFWTYEIQKYDFNASIPVGAVLESGYMYLNPEEAFIPTKYNDQDNSFITYNG